MTSIKQLYSNKCRYPASCGMPVVLMVHPEVLCAGQLVSGFLLFGVGQTTDTQRLFIIHFAADADELT